MGWYQSEKLGRPVSAFISTLQVEPLEPFNFKLKAGPHWEGRWAWGKPWQHYCLIKGDLKGKAELDLCSFMFPYDTKRRANFPFTS